MIGSRSFPETLCALVISQDSVFVAPTASPQDFHVISNRSYNLQLTWMPPPNSDSRGIIRYYLVKYRAVSCSTGTPIQARWSVTTAKATLKSKSIRICPYPTCYDVWISAVTVGGSPYAKNTNVKMAGHGMPVLFTATKEAFMQIFHIIFLLLYVNSFLCEILEY